MHHGSATAADSGEPHRDKYRKPASGLQLDGESEEEGCSAAVARRKKETRARFILAAVLAGDFRRLEAHPTDLDRRGEEGTGVVGPRIARVSRCVVLR